LLSVAATMTGQINLLLLLLLLFLFLCVVVVKDKDNSFQFTSIFIKKKIKLGFFLKNNKTETKPVLIWFSLTRFFIWLSFSGLAPFFRFGFGPVWFFRFHAYKIKIEPVGFLKILINLIGFFL
jgi:hypothetical protein